MTTSPANNIDVKRRNRVNTLRCILKSDRVSQMELTQKLALSWPTILQNVKELTELGLVREDGVYASTGGRKAKAYAPVRDARVAVGVDLTADHVGVVLTDLGGNLLKQATGALRFSMEEIYFKYLGGLLQRFVEASGAADRILGVGIALPGIVDGSGACCGSPTLWSCGMCRLAALPSRYPGPAAAWAPLMPRAWRSSGAWMGIWSISPWTTPWAGPSSGTGASAWGTTSGRGSSGT